MLVELQEQRLLLQQPGAASAGELRGRKGEKRRGLGCEQGASMSEKLRFTESHFSVQIGSLLPPVFTFRVSLVWFLHMLV